MVFARYDLPIEQDNRMQDFAVDSLLPQAGPQVQRAADIGSQQIVGFLFRNDVQQVLTQCAGHLRVLQHIIAGGSTAA